METDRSASWHARSLVGAGPRRLRAAFHNKGARAEIKRAESRVERARAAVRARRCAALSLFLFLLKEKMGMIPKAGGETQVKRALRGRGLGLCVERLMKIYIYIYIYICKLRWI